MCSRHILSTFDRFQRERLVFVQAALDYSRQAENVGPIISAGGVTLLRHLCQDPVPSIQYAAMLALGRLASHSRPVAETLANEGFHDLLVERLMAAPVIVTEGRDSILGQQARRAAALCLKGLTKHDAALAQRVAASGVVEAVVACLREQDADLVEAVGWVLGNIAGHSPELAKIASDAGAVSPLIACLSSPELAVKRIAASALSDIAKHGPELAQGLVDAGAVAQLAASLAAVAGGDVRLQRQACCALGQIAKLTPELAAAVTEGGLEEIIKCLNSADAVVRRHAAVALRDMARLGESTAQRLVDSGCIPRLVAATAPGEQMLAAIMAIGYLSAYTEAMASRVAGAGAIPALARILVTGTPDHILSATVWALGQLGHHSAELAKDVADAGIILEVVRRETADSSSEDLKAKCGKALAGILAVLTDFATLEQLVQKDLQTAHLEVVLQQISGAIAANPARRAGFVQSGALKAVEEIGEAPGSPFKEHMEKITAHFPEEIVRYYSPTYSKQLLSKLNEPPANEEQLAASAEGVSGPAEGRD